MAYYQLQHSQLALLPVLRKPQQLLHWLPARMLVTVLLLSNAPLLKLLAWWPPQGLQLQASWMLLLLRFQSSDSLLKYSASLKDLAMFQPTPAVEESAEVQGNQLRLAMVL